MNTRGLYSSGIGPIVFPRLMFRTNQFPGFIDLLYLRVLTLQKAKDQILDALRGLRYVYDFDGMN
jgi:hypothetical protein